MKELRINKPIGLKSYIQEIENICKISKIYKLGLRPEHLIIPLDKGCGRTTLIQYITDMFKNYQILEFNSGLDDFLEISFDGTQENLIQSFNKIDSAAIYTNEYSNIVAMDLSGISSNPMGFNQNLFIENCARVCENALAIFFVSSLPTKFEERLIKSLTDSIGNIKRLELETYTDEDLSLIVLKVIDNYGIEIKDYESFKTNVLDLIVKNDIDSIPETLDLAKELIHYTVFSSFNPTISSEDIEELVNNKCQYLKGVS